MNVLLDVMCQGAQDVADHFTEPDDDFAPILMMVNEENECGAADLGEFFSDPEAKELLPDVLRRIVLEWKPVRVAMAVSAWALELEGRERYDEYLHGAEPSPRSHPERIEVVVVFTVDRDGHAEQRMARIIRHESEPPEIEPFRGAGEPEGHFVSALKEAMREL